MSTLAHPARRSLTQSLRSRYIALKRHWTPIRRYVVRVNHEWAIIHLDERQGAFSCQSSYGTYAYIWRAIGDRTLKQFLCGLNFDYFMNKTCERYERFDHDRTVANLRHSIKESRRWGNVDKRIAREAWSDLDYFEDNPHDYEGQAFAAEMYRSDALMECLGGDLCDTIRMGPKGDCVQFWKIIWPGFIEQIGGRK